MTIRISRRLLLAAAALTPAGCSGLLPNGEAPPRLYRLTAADDFPPSSRHVSAQLLVDVPASAAALDTDRIALSRSPTTIDYFADAAWTDRAPLMVQTLLVESFENSGQITAVARESLSLQASDILQSELRHFEADYTGGGPPVARVRIVVDPVHHQHADRIIEEDDDRDGDHRAFRDPPPARLIEIREKAARSAVGRGAFDTLEGKTLAIHPATARPVAHAAERVSAPVAHARDALTKGHGSHAKT